MKKALIAVALTLTLAFAAAPAHARPGKLDQSFGHHGRRVVHGVQDEAKAVAIGRKGRIVVAGLHTVARVRPDGRLDHSFAHDGIASLAAPPGADSAFAAVGSGSVAVGPKGTVFVAGAACSETAGCDFAVRRLKRNGQVDDSFGEDGTARIGFSKPGSSSATAIEISHRGMLVVAGTNCNPGGCAFGLTRLDHDGNLDRSFGNGGRVVGSFGGCSPALGGMALDSRERIVVAGSCQNKIASLERFEPDGEVDLSFGNGGTVRKYVFIRRVDALAIDSHDRIDLAGLNHKGYGVVRFGRSGRYDSSFGDHGTARADFRGAQYVDARTAAIDSRGRIVVAGAAQDVGFQPGFAFARFKPGGRVDRKFGDDGTVQVGRRKGFRYAESVATDRRNRIVGAGLQRQPGHRHIALVRLLG